MKQVDLLIAGGGVAGITAALVAQQASKSVCLVEAAPALGGLLRSSSYENYSFDYGTHFINYTQDPEVDQLLMPQVNEDWLSFHYLKAGSYFKKTNSESPLINAADVLPADVYQKGVAELLDIVSNNVNADNMRDQLVQKFGDTFATHIFIPAMEKLFFEKAENLKVNAQLRYGLHRLIVSTSETSIKLKQIPELDERIAFHTSAYTSQTAKHLYPKQGGVGQWMDYLISRVDDQSIHLNNKIKTIHKESSGFIVGLESGEKILCKKLVWTLAPALYFMALGEQHKMERPHLLHTELFHFVFEQPFVSDLFYLTDYDPSHAIFRTTLYSNVQGDKSDFRATVEVLRNDQGETSLERILKELAESGVIKNSVVPRFVKREFFPNTFPVLNHQYTKAQQYYTKEMEKHPDTCFVGKAASEQFFMTDVLKDVVYKIKQLCEFI